MFNQGQRIRTTKEILTIFRNGEVVRVGAISWYFLTGAETKVTVIVDKKLSKLAVVRNLVKRRIRAALREVGLPQGETIVRGFSGAEKLSYLEIVQALQKCRSNPKLQK